jgi:hypothetical protein
MQIQRTSMTQPVDVGASSSRPAPAPQPTPTPVAPHSPAAPVASQHELVKTDETQKHRKAEANLPSLSSGDRAAIASSTGFYISPSGEVTPEGMPPWAFIMQTIERRHKADAAAVEQHTTATTSTSATSEGVDVTV